MTPRGKAQLSEPRLQQHARFVALWDAIEPAGPADPETYAEFCALRDEMEQQHPGFLQSLARVHDLETVFRSTNNGAAAWEAVAVSMAAGWPMLPRWVLRYLADAAPGVVSASTDATLRSALRLHKAGGPAATRRLETARRRRAGVTRMLEVITLLRSVSTPPAKVGDEWDEPSGKRMSARAVRELNATRQAACTWVEALPVSQRPTPGEDVAVSAARIVGVEIGRSPRTLINWYNEDTVDDPMCGRVLAADTRLTLPETP